MTAIEIMLGIDDQVYAIQHLDPSVRIKINGDHALGLEVLEYLKKFESSAGKIEVV